MVTLILIEQGIGHCAQIPGRRLLGSWLLCCIIICTVYKAKLTSVLINPPTEHLATLGELAKLGYDAHFYELDPNLAKETFQQMIDPEKQKIAKKIRGDLNICDVLKKSLNNNVFLIEEQVLIQQAVSLCPKTLSIEELARIRVTKDNMLLSSHAWCFAKRTPYIESFNYYISLFEQNGLHIKWSEYLYGTSRKKTIDFDKGIVKIDISPPMKLHGPLLIWTYGVVVSICIFVWEILYWYCIVLKRSRDIC